MAIARTFCSIAVLIGATLATSTWAADTVQGAKAQPTNPAMGIGMHAGAKPSGYADQMKLMQSGMNMMGGMGGMGGMGVGAAAGKPADMAARQGMMEQRMDMMQMMMQMMMDRTPSIPPTK